MRKHKQEAIQDGDFRSGIDSFLCYRVVNFYHKQWYCSVLFQMNFVLVITLLFCVVMKLAASTIGSFRTPGLCDPFNSFDDTFLLSTSSVKTRGNVYTGVSP